MKTGVLVSEEPEADSDRQLRPEDSSGQRQRDEHSPVGHQHHGGGEQVRRLEAGQREQRQGEGGQEEESQRKRVRASFHNEIRLRPSCSCAGASRRRSTARSPRRAKKCATSWRSDSPP